MNRKPERVLEVESGAWDRMRALSREGYPEEVCGVLLGEVTPRKATEVISVRNVHQVSRRSRFEVDPLEYQKIEREADERGRMVLGFYHSHPDHPAVPSQTDAAYAAGWPDYSFVIVTVARGKTAGFRSWRWSETQGVFLEESVIRRAV